MNFLRSSRPRTGAAPRPARRTANVEPLDACDNTVDPHDFSWRRPPATRTQLRQDIVLAAVLLVGALISVALHIVADFSWNAERGPVWGSLIWVVAMCVPIAFRRRWPGAVALVASAAFIIGGELQVSETIVSNIALFIALYTAGAWLDNRRASRNIRVAIIIAMFVWLSISIFRSSTNPEILDEFSTAGALSPFVAMSLIQVITNLLYFGGAYYFGDSAYAAARQRAVVAQRTIELESEREHSARQAVAIERLRIARELHDVVAHHVSVMGVQAGAARTVIDRDLAAARSALADIESEARTAIDELQHLLHTLRGEDDEVPTASASALGADALDALVRDATASGLPTTLAVIGTSRPLPGTVKLNLYRIAQEALTNARKYAGSAATADVRLRYRPNAVELEVTNTGTVPTAVRPGALGQIGMRERVDAMGGVLEIGPRSHSGYVVRATVPLRVAEKAVPTDAEPVQPSATPGTPQGDLHPSLPQDQAS